MKTVMGRTAPSPLLHTPHPCTTQTLSNCGDAIRFSVTPGADVNNCLDNTIWFDSISNSVVGGSRWGLLRAGWCGGDARGELRR